MQSCIWAQNALYMLLASVAEWSIALDCKSSDISLRRFESYPAHQMKKTDCRSVFFIVSEQANCSFSKMTYWVRLR